jgi:hypothetical protein
MGYVCEAVSVQGMMMHPGQQSAQHQRQLMGPSSQQQQLAQQSSSSRMLGNISLDMCEGEDHFEVRVV